MPFGRRRHAPRQLLGRALGRHGANHVIVVGVEGGYRQRINEQGRDVGQVIPHGQNAEMRYRDGNRQREDRKQSENTEVGGDRNQVHQIAQCQRGDGDRSDRDRPPIGKVGHKSPQQAARPSDVDQRQYGRADHGAERDGDRGRDQAGRNLLGQDEVVIFPGAARRASKLRSRRCDRQRPGGVVPGGARERWRSSDHWRHQARNQTGQRGRIHDLVQTSPRDDQSAKPQAQGNDRSAGIEADQFNGDAVRQGDPVEFPNLSGQEQDQRHQQ